MSAKYHSVHIVLSIVIFSRLVELKPWDNNTSLFVTGMPQDKRNEYIFIGKSIINADIITTLSLAVRSTASQTRDRAKIDVELYRKMQLNIE